ncbi:MAG: transglutaminase domain-containing protein, partial [Acetatifactor sp.]|nr:transglutaminase domain-containing protein [Acetatifactor sp.]
MSDFRFEDIENLACDLPEDILKRKWHGDFKGANRLIGLWMEKDIPAGLRNRLILEREILKRLPAE